MKLVSLNVGKPGTVMHHNKPVLSGINKTPVTEALFLSRTGFKEDGQADLVNHGGPDKAVCVYAYEHYPYWEQQLNQPLFFGAFGENMTTSGLKENTIYIGDQFQIGEAVVQVSQPRQPCFKLAAKYGTAKLPLYVKETGFTGFYLRVLTEGTVQPGSVFSLVARLPESLTVEQANQVMNANHPDSLLLQAALQNSALAESWKAPLRKKRQT